MGTGTRIRSGTEGPLGPVTGTESEILSVIKAEVEAKTYTETGTVAPSVTLWELKWFQVQNPGTEPRQELILIPKDLLICEFIQIPEFIFWLIK